MKSSKDVLGELKDRLDYLSEQQNNMNNYYMVEQVQKSVDDLEEIINELIGETVDLNNSLKTKGATHAMQVKRLRGEKFNTTTFVENYAKEFLNK